VVLAATLVYGNYRLNQIDFEQDPARQGPRVAVIQEDFPLVSTPPYGDHAFVILSRYLALAAQAIQEKPDLVVFPETAWNASQNIGYIEQPNTIPEAMPELRPYSLRCHEAVSALVRGDYPGVNAVISNLEAALRNYLSVRRDETAPIELPRLPAEGGTPVTALVGAVSIEQFPEATYPKIKRYNSALVYDPDGTQRRERYDKHHLVPFGELVPFRQAEFLGVNLHWLYRWLNSLSPFSDRGKIEYSLTPGEQFTVFLLETATGVYRFGVPICYEDTVPYVIRRFVWDGAERRVDFLVNISNDGWFLRSAELRQHLASCVFRAVENRVTIARAVNTGISGFVDPDGQIYARVTKNGRDFGPGVIGYAVERVRLDDRASLYGRVGDLFAIACLLLTTALWIGAVFERWVLALRQRIALLFGKGGH
jgi:apolipoprotein N-acyltransferase